MSWTRLPDSIGHRTGLESAERRFAVVMALLGIAFGLRLVANDSTFWNFPCNSPCVHTTFWAKPMLDWLIYSWVGYAGFSFLFFSVDYFGRFSRGETVRELCGRIATVLLYLYPAFVLFVALTAQGSYFLPGWAQGPYWFLAAWILGLLVIHAGQTAIGTKLLGRNTVLARALVHSLELVESGMRSEGAFVRYQRLKLLALLTGRPIDVDLDASKKSVRPETISLVATLGAVSVAVTWAFTEIRGLELLGVLDAVFFGFMVFSAILGWALKKRDSNRRRGELRVPKSLWSRFRTDYLERLLAWAGGPCVKSKARRVATNPA